MSIPAAVRLLSFVALGCAAVARAQAPCTNAWQSGDPIAGLDGTAYAMVVGDPDGAGPLPTGVVVGGEFTVAGAHRVTNVAFYEPVARQWLPIGSLPVRVTSLLVRGNGRIVAGSIFGGVHEFDGASWQPIGPSSSQPPVSALAELPNGDLVVGGNIAPSAGIPGNGILRWNGTQWSAMGNPTYLTSVGNVLAMARLPNGDLVVGGFFDQIGGVSCNHVARWNGVAWQPLGAGVPNGVTQLAASAAGEVVVDGDFGAQTFKLGLIAAPLGGPCFFRGAVLVGRCGFCRNRRVYHRSGTRGNRPERAVHPEECRRHGSPPGRRWRAHHRPQGAGSGRPPRRCCARP